MKSKPPELDKKDPDSIYNWIVYKLSSPEFGDPLKFYIQDNCETFMNVNAENTFEQGNIFNNFNLILESLLSNILAEGNITQEQFLQATERGLNDPKNQKYFNIIISLGNYIYFKIIMIRYNQQRIALAKYNSNKEKEKEKQMNDKLINEITPELVNLILQKDELQHPLDEDMKENLEEEIKRRLNIIEEEERRRTKKKKEEPKKKEEENKKNVEKDDKKYINIHSEENKDGVFVNVYDKQNMILSPLVKNPYFPNPFKRDNKPKEEKQGNGKELTKDIIEKSLEDSIMKYEDILLFLNDEK